MSHQTNPLVRGHGWMLHSIAGTPCEAVRTVLETHFPRAAGWPQCCAAEERVTHVLPGVSLTVHVAVIVRAIAQAEKDAVG